MTTKWQVWIISHTYYNITNHRLVHSFHLQNRKIIESTWYEHTQHKHTQDLLLWTWLYIEMKAQRSAGIMNISGHHSTLLCISFYIRIMQARNFHLRYIRNRTIHQVSKESCIKSMTPMVRWRCLSASPYLAPSQHRQHACIAICMLSVLFIIVHQTRCTCIGRLIWIFSSILINLEDLVVKQAHVLWLAKG